VEQDQTPPGRALALRPVVVAWLLAVGVDLLLNAGLFAGLFDREPGLLADEVLFRRIPVAYLGLATGVVGLAWLIDRADQRGALAGARMSALAGVVVASMGVVSLWSAIDMTGLFVAAGALVQVVELTAAGAVLGAFRVGGDRRRLTRRVLLLALSLAVLGIVAQNILNGNG